MFHQCRHEWGRMNLSNVFSKSLSDFQKPGEVMARKDNSMLMQSLHYFPEHILLGTVKDKVVGEIDALPTLFVPAFLLSK